MDNSIYRIREADSLSRQSAKALSTYRIDQSQFSRLSHYVGTYVLIPARSGSKGIKHKNIKLYKGLPLLVHSIKIAQKCVKYIKPENIFVSTDSEEYAKIAKEYGATILSLRPKEISDDLSTDSEVFQHMNEELEKNGIPKPDLWIHLRPTYPNRSLELLEDTIETFINNYDDYDSLRTIIPYEKTPYKMYHMEGTQLIPIFQKYKDIEEPYNQCRQLFEQTYLHNGCIDIIKNEVIESGKMSGERIYGYKMKEDEDDDIDTEKDFKKSENK